MQRPQSKKRAPFSAFSAASAVHQKKSVFLGGLGGLGG